MIFETAFRTSYMSTLYFTGHKSRKERGPMLLILSIRSNITDWGSNSQTQTGLVSDFSSVTTKTISPLRPL